MNNNQKKVYIDQNGNKIVLEEIMTFEIEELGKRYLAFTVNDNGTSDNVCVNLVELFSANDNNLHIKKIESNEENIVKYVFQRLMQN